MKILLITALMLVSASSFAERIEIPCDFKEDRDAREEFVITGTQENGVILAEGYHNGVTAQFAHNDVEGRTLVVSFGSNSFSKTLGGGLKSIEYKAGLVSMMMKVDRKLHVRCHPQNLKVIQ